MKVCVIGLGYIGLPTSAILASRGHHVYGVDVDKDIIEHLNKGSTRIAEPDLADAVSAAVHSGRLKAGLKPQNADAFIIAVPTPFKEGHQPDISHVVAAAESIIPNLKKGNLVILESTSPVGTTRLLERMFRDSGIDTKHLRIAYCPERVLPGKIMQELVENDRVVGGITPEATAAVTAFYGTFVKGNVFTTDDKTAEMVKLTENSFRDVNVAFANELSMLCDKLGINVWELIKLANRHPRVKILSPGCGVGGHCIAVDPWFIVSDNPETAQLIAAARRQNDYKSRWCAEKVIACAKKFESKHGKKPVIACMGLAFKPDVDDLRESPAVGIATELAGRGYELAVSEPNIAKHSLFKLVPPEDAVRDADIAVFLVAHSAFKKLAPRKNCIVLDFCGVTLK